MTQKTFTASHVRARISPFKARPVANLVRGKNAEEALRILEYEPRRAAPMLRKVIKSALANASNDLEVKLNRLVIVDARVDGGPPLTGGRRFRPGPMGRAMPIKKRTSHITISLAEALESDEAAGAPAKKRSKKKPAPAAKAGGAAGAPAQEGA